jgi:hypothetical protein
MRWPEQEVFQSDPGPSKRYKTIGSVLVTLRQASAHYGKVA